MMYSSNIYSICVIICVFCLHTRMYVNIQKYVQKVSFLAELPASCEQQKNKARIEELINFCWLSDLFNPGNSASERDLFWGWVSEFT